VGVGAGAGVLPLPVETPPQPESNIANATAETRGINLKCINAGPNSFRSDALARVDVGPPQPNRW
jgi:hypothetical protein